MHTADDYFAELEEYLRQMPEAERAETMTYYREYAQEGGLLDAEQLREHFGPPEVLAARILEDEAGKRTQDAPQRTEGTGVRPAAVLAGIMIAVAALGIGAFKFLRPGTAAEPAVTTESALSRDAGTAQPDVRGPIRRIRRKPAGERCRVTTERWRPLPTFRWIWRR